MVNFQVHNESATKDCGISTSSRSSSNDKPPPIYAEVQKFFNAHSDGRISPKDLQAAFEIFQNKHFSDASCKFIVRLFDLDRRGGLDLKEFEQLYYYMKQWVSAFHAYDFQHAGYLDQEEFANALKHMDIHFSPEFINYLMKRCNSSKEKIALDQFIMTCIQIQKYTEEFKKLDANFTGEIQLRYEDFLEMILRCM